IEDMLKKQPKINFWALQSMNPDIKAWIQIPDTPIDYPVLNATKEEGQDYYLRRNYEKKKNNHGSIYIQTGLNTQFDDTVTVIYGHNMKDGTMFGWLHHLSEETTAAEHPEMYIYLPERTIKAELLSCYTTDDRLVFEKFNDFSSAQDRLDYIYTFENKTALCDLKENDIVNGKCKLITLSTCTSGGTQRELAQYLITDEDYHEQETGKN
ncbi:MAG: class B sortase, partial [Lachnospiraceae bacterium]|nr:class B sortase [Lachnospiraceae bacterium]